MEYYRDIFLYKLLLIFEFLVKRKHFNNMRQNKNKSQKINFIFTIIFKVAVKSQYVPVGTYIKISGCCKFLLFL